MAVTISRALGDRIAALAAADPRREVCGLLLGDGARIEAIIVAANVADDPARRFEIDPRVIFRAMRAERAGGPRVIGHYHSHPGGSGEPSAEDARLARPGPLWLIVAQGRIRAWRFDGVAFAEEQLHDCG